MGEFLQKCGCYIDKKGKKEYNNEKQVGKRGGLEAIKSGL